MEYGKAKAMSLKNLPVTSYPAYTWLYLEEKGVSFDIIDEELVKSATLADGTFAKLICSAVSYMILRISNTEQVSISP